MERLLADMMFINESNKQPDLCVIRNKSLLHFKNLLLTILEGNMIQLTGISATIVRVLAEFDSYFCRAAFLCAAGNVIGL